MADFLMPSLGADMEAGTLVAWRKRPGDMIARGEILAEVETDKGIIEIECFTAGTVGALLVQPGAKVPVGTPLASIQQVDETSAVPERVAATPAAARPGTAVAEDRLPSAPALSAAPGVGVQPPVSTLRELAPDGYGPSASKPRELAPRTESASANGSRHPSPTMRATPAARRRMRESGLAIPLATGAGVITPADLAASSLRAAPGPATEAIGAIDAASSTRGSAAPRLRVSPFARRLATDLGVRLDALAGSGPDGAIVANDVRGAAAAEPSAADSARSPEARMRAAIASLVSRSKREIPHFYLLHTADLSKTLTWLRVENERRSMEERVLLGALFVRAVAQAVKKVPELNAHFVKGTAVLVEDVHVGVAVALRGGGLIAPALQHADRLSFDVLNRSFKDLVQRARAGQLKSSEMAGATITITSLGERGVESVLPVIMPPQVAMVGFGTPLERARVVDGAVVARPTVALALAADHRVSDGHRGALFLSAVQRFLEEPPA